VHAAMARRGGGLAQPDPDGSTTRRHRDDGSGPTMSVTLPCARFRDENLGRASRSLCRSQRHSATITGTMFDVKVDRDENVALHDQVAAEIRRAIADGEAGPGDRLPPAKDLAAVLDVNANTVLRALRILRDEGLLEFRRGRGVTVAGTPERSAVLRRARELVEFARHQGYRREDVIDIISGLP
jgi:GntR family transcriptional regulator